jgi:hypothetical protein
MRVKHPAALAIVVTVLLVSAAFRAGAADNTPASTDAQSSSPQSNSAQGSGAPATLQPQPPAAVTVLTNHEVEGILGHEVVSSANENMGRIVDVLVDRGGEVRAAIIDFGGFLGVGSRKIAVEWNALHFPPPGKPDEQVTLDLNRDQVKEAPAYEDGKPVVILGALGKLEPLPFE